MSKSDKLYLGLGPMSEEIIEAVVESSHCLNEEGFDNIQLMFVCSENHINRDGGYTGLTTRDFVRKIEKLERDFPQSNVWKCRDHCGPGFFYDSIDECVSTIRDDIGNGFDLLHIDTCFLDSIDDKLAATKLMMSEARVLSKGVKFEIGTEVNSVKNRLEPDVLRRFLDDVDNIATPFFYVLETGAVVQGYNNSSVFEPCQESLDIIRAANVLVKEHNADYLTYDQVGLRRGKINALNVAPQLGVIQTAVTLSYCHIFGVNADDFKRRVYDSGKWSKWKHSPYAASPDEAVLLGGHYNFQTDEYKRLIDELTPSVDVRSNIVHAITALIEHYVAGYEHYGF